MLLPFEYLSLSFSKAAHNGTYLSATKLQRNCNEISPTWNKKQFIECNIMVQKYLAMVAILGAIALASIGMITTGINQVKADGFGSFGPGGWHCDWQYNSNGYKVCESYNQKPTVQSIDWHCIWQKRL